MQKILVPTDFSDNALKAVAQACEIAKKNNAVIHLLHVVEPTLNMATMQADSSGKKVVADKSKSLELSLKAIAEVYPDVKILPFLVGGNVIPSILKYAENENPDLIVMGTKGASGLKKILIGSVTAGTIGKTNFPVLTVPASYELQKPTAIVFATNQFEKDEALLKNFVNLANLFSVPVHVIVFKDIDANEDADFIYNEEQLNYYLGFLKETFPRTVFKGEILEGSDFESAIDAYCVNNTAGIIAMVTYPKSFFEKFFFKSFTKNMAFHSAIPILAIPGILQEAEEFL
jgi:nucleotide-binding universal stress UspA family protein